MNINDDNTDTEQATAETAEATETEETTKAAGGAIDDALNAALRTGRGWARRGLTAAEDALEKGAQKLRTTAETLAQASERFAEPTD